MNQKLKRSYNNWMLFLKGTALITAGIITLLAFLALFLL